MGDDQNIAGDGPAQPPERQTPRTPSRKRNTKPKSKRTKLEKKIFLLAELGLTPEQIAAACDVSHVTVYKWMKDPDFRRRLKESSLVADRRVVQSLYQRACGFVCEEEKAFLRDGEPIIVPVKKHYPPDTDAIRFWLTNRQPEEWSNRQKTDVSGTMVIQVVNYADPDHPA